jgi:hypothetical protein
MIEVPVDYSENQQSWMPSFLEQKAEESRRPLPRQTSSQTDNLHDFVDMHNSIHMQSYHCVSSLLGGTVQETLPASDRELLIRAVGAYARHRGMAYCPARFEQFRC